MGTSQRPYNPDGRIKTISIKDIEGKAYMADYVDEYVMCGNSLADVMGGEECIRVAFCLIVFCIEGRLEITVNNVVYRLQHGDMLTCLPTSIISDAMLSNTHRVKVFGFSPAFMEGLLLGEGKVESIVEYVRESPLRSVSATQLDSDVLMLYGNIISRKAADSARCFKRKIMQGIFAAFFCEIMTEMAGRLTESHSNSGEMRRATIVCKNFIKAVATDDGTHRSVGYYADRLCYSSKYLSHVVKSVSGRTATSWINDHTIEIVKHHLRHSDKSVKEIADAMGFPNLSFFGKYVKRHTGLSPVAYRNHKPE